MSQKTAKECRRAERECKAQVLTCKEFAELSLRCNRNCLKAMTVTEETIQAFGRLEDVRREQAVRKALMPFRIIMAVQNVAILAIVLAIVKDMGLL